MDADRRRGSVLLLMPAGILVVIVLGAMAVDLSAVHLAEREAHAAATAAVNDAVTAGLDEESYLQDGRYDLDPRRVTAIVDTTLRSWSVAGHDLARTGPPRLSDADGDGWDDTVSITVSLTTAYVFAPAIPGADHSFTVESTATASAVRAP